LSSNLVETRIRIGDFLKLRPGDVIPVDLPELITLGADEIPLFHARVGTAGGNNALRLVEPVRHLLDGSPKAERAEGDERWTASLRDDVLDAEIELSSNLVETRIRIGDFLKLRPGDVIPVDLPETVTLGADEIPLFHARFGTAGGNNALRLVQPIVMNRKSQIANGESSVAATPPFAINDSRFAKVKS
jgi:flagellar motor switch protein FliM